MDQQPLDIDRTRWRAYRSKLFHFVRARVKDEALADDLVQDILAKAYARRDTLRDHDKLQAWLFRIARTTIIDHFRTHKPTEALPADLEGHSSDARQAERELARCMRPLVEALPAHYRRAIVLAELEGWKQREVAEQLGLSVSGAKSRIQRGRRMLEEMLLDCCRVEFDSRGHVMAYEASEDCGRCGDQ